VPDKTPRKVELPQFGGASLELPASASAMGVGSATLESGGSLLLRHGAGPGGVWLIRVTEVDAAKSAEDGGSRFVPLGDLTSTPLCVSRQEEQTEDDPLPTGTMVAEALVAVARAKVLPR